MRSVCKGDGVVAAVVVLEAQDGDWDRWVFATSMRAVFIQGKQNKEAAWETGCRGAGLLTCLLPT